MVCFIQILLSFHRENKPNKAYYCPILQKPLLPSLPSKSFTISVTRLQCTAHIYESAYNPTK